MSDKHLPSVVAYGMFYNGTSWVPGAAVTAADNLPNPTAQEVLSFAMAYDTANGNWDRWPATSNFNITIGAVPPSIMPNVSAYAQEFSGVESTFTTVFCNTGQIGNLWNNAATGAGGTSTAVDTFNCGILSFMGTSSGATTLTVQYSPDNAAFYDSSTTIVLGGAGDFGVTVSIGAEYVRLKSSNNVTVTATVQGKH